MQNEGDLIAPALFNDLDEKEVSVEKLFLNDDSIAIVEGLIESNSKEELISPEDLAWVDSCLVADPELSMESWASLKEALLDSITTIADSYEENNAVGPDEGDNGEQMVVDEEEEVLRKPEIVDDQGDAVYVRAMVNHTEGDHRGDDDGEEEIRKEIVSPESIFRVWDLKEEEEHELIPELMRAVAGLQVVEEEEDQFLIELKQAVAESILRDEQRVPTDEASIAEDGNLDEIISRIWARRCLMKSYDGFNCKNVQPDDFLCRNQAILKEEHLQKN